MAQLYDNQLLCSKCGESNFLETETSLKCQICDTELELEEVISLLESAEEKGELNSENSILLLRLKIKRELNKPFRNYPLIRTYANELLSLVPEDFQAQFFKAFANHKKRPEEYEDFLYSFDSLLTSKDKKAIYPLLIDECDIEDRDAVYAFLKRVGDDKKEGDRLEAALKRNEEQKNHKITHKDVFLAYSYKDKNKVKEVTTDLEKAELTLLDPYLHLPKELDLFDRGVRECLDNCSLVVSFVSPSSKASRDVQNMLSQASKFHKTVVEITINEDDPLNVHELSDALPLFFIGSKYAKTIQEIYEQLVQIEDDEEEEVEKEPLSYEKKLNYIYAYIQLSRLPQAREMLSPLLKEKPNDVTLNYYALLIETDNKRVSNDQAKEIYKKFVALVPDKEKEYKKEFSILFEDDPEQCYKKGLHYSIEKTEEGYKKAIEYFLKAGDKHPKALYQLGHAYRFGWGVEPNFDKALSYYEKSLALGNEDANFDLGSLCYTGVEGKKDIAKAIPYLKEAAKKDNRNAIRILGNIYYFGDGVKTDYDQAFYYYSKISETDDSDVLNRLGDIYYYGRGTKVNYTKAIDFYKKSANYNNNNALFNLGYIYQFGKGVNKNYSLAEQYYLKAYEGNNSFAPTYLGDFYYYSLYEHQDYAKARMYYLKAAEKNDVRAFFQLGELYFYGRGVTQDYKEAVKWYQKAASNGNADAQANLGYCYYHGYGIGVDKKKALSLFLEAAKKDQTTATNFIGYYYECGIIVPKDKELARFWYSQAAKKGNEYAQKHLAALK